MPANAVTLKEKAYLMLRKGILGGELKPGEVLTERMLVEWLEMSRTPIRAALERLDAEGLAIYTPNKGLTVAELSLTKACDLYDYRIAMECFVIRKLSSRVWETEEIRWFEQNLEQQRSCIENRDHLLFTEADAAFHHKLAAVLGNAEILQAMERIQDKLCQIAVQVLRKDYTRIQVSYEDHVRIFQLLQDGNKEAAAQAMEQHLEFGKRILVQ